MKDRYLVALLEKEVDMSGEPICYNWLMPEANCPKCGAYYRGWALLNPRHQTCSRCGVALEIVAPEYKVFKGYSPFTADELVINPPGESVPPQDTAKGRRGKSKKPPHS
jgi:hypothetical protein